MSPRIAWSLFAIALTGGVLFAGPLRGDVVVLKSGGEIRGEIVADPKASAKSDLVTIRTLTGATVSIAKDDVESITRRRLAVEEYETRRRIVPDTIQGQWELAEWCRQKSLLKEREVHLQRVIELDPDHEAAHRALGHVRHEGHWSTRDEIMTARGYVKYKGKYVLPQELELLQQEERESESEKAWYRRVKMWLGWLEGDKPERQAEALTQFRSIRDADAVPAMYRSFSGHAVEDFRTLYLDVLAKIEGEKPIGPLVYQAMKDDSQVIRNQALWTLRKRDHAKAVPAFIKFLKNDANLIVNRAGTALGEMGDDKAIPYLIEALVTSHRYRVEVPDQNPIGFRGDGAMVQTTNVPLPPNIAAMLATGQLPYGVQINQVPAPGPELRKKTILVRKDEQNPSVLTSLQQLTGQNFGYDESAWRSWYRAQQNGTLPKKSKP